MLRPVLLVLLAASQITHASKPVPAPATLCPSELQTTVTASAPPGWEQMPDKAVLTQVWLFGGHPDYASKLSPRNSTNGGSEWQLDATSKAVPWLKCQYSTPGLTLMRPLPAKLSLCRLQCQHTCRFTCS